MSKSTSKATTEATTEATATVKVSAAIVAEIGQAAAATDNAYAAIRASDQQVIKLALKVREDKILANLFASNDDGSGGRSAVQTALKPYFVEAYGKVSQTSVYAVEQLSRVLTLAFGPSGAKVTPKQRAKALEQMAQGLAKNANTQAIIALASGRKVYTAKGELADVKTSHTSSSTTTPAETMTKALNATVTAFVREAKGDALPVLIAVIEALRASEAIDEETADALTTAAQENC